MEWRRETPKERENENPQTEACGEGEKNSDDNESVAESFGAVVLSKLLGKNEETTGRDKEMGQAEAGPKI